MSILAEAYRNILNEDFEKDGFYVYHGTGPEALNGLFDAGFERIFTSSKGGNMYGAGVYSTYKLASGFQNTNGTYGNYLLKLKVKSLRNFVIYDKNIAMKVYKTDSIDEQLKKILSPEEYSTVRNSRYIDYDKVCNTRGDIWTSTCAYNLIQGLLNYHPSIYYKINGYIFYGHNDGYVCLISDFKNVYPVALTKDGGKTFDPIPETKNFKDFGVNDVDLKWVLGKYNYELLKSLDFCPYNFTNNFARVIKNGKCNFLYRGKPLKEGVISPVWFDEAPETFNKKNNAIVTIGGERLILHLNPSEKKFYVYYDDGRYFCELESLDFYIDQYTNKMREFQMDDPDEDY